MLNTVSGIEDDTMIMSLMAKFILKINPGCFFKLGNAALIMIILLIKDQIPIKHRQLEILTVLSIAARSTVQYQFKKYQLQYLQPILKLS